MFICTHLSETILIFALCRDFFIGILNFFYNNPEFLEGFCRWKIKMFQFFAWKTKKLRHSDYSRFVNKNWCSNYTTRLLRSLVQSLRLCLLPRPKILVKKQLKIKAIEEIDSLSIKKVIKMTQFWCYSEFLIKMWRSAFQSPRKPSWTIRISHIANIKCDKTLDRQFEVKSRFF